MSLGDHSESSTLAPVPTPTAEKNAMVVDPEKAEGSIDTAPTLDSAIDDSDPFKVGLEANEDPHNITCWQKWSIVLIISASSFCVTCLSSIASFAETAVGERFHVGHTVTVLSISLFVEGLGWGPLLVGPLSEVYGRNPIYITSYFLLFAFTFPVAFAPHISVYLIFRFLQGFCGSAFLSVAGGTVSDLFDDKTVSNPMAVYTISPFIGPVFGPLISGFVNQNLWWRWTYWIMIIWIFCQFLVILIFVPETFAPVIIKRKAAKLRKETGDSRYWAPLDHHDKSLVWEIVVSCYKPFELMIYDRMALLLNIWTALILGILYLTFQAFPVIFMEKHGFNMQMTGLTYLGIGLGLTLALASQPWWNRFFRRKVVENGGHPEPEIRLYMGELGGILVPLGLYWIAFTTWKSIHWIVPILGSVPFGAGIFLVFNSVFTYLVTAYRPIAASAMASNSALRSAFAAAFPLFAGPMYHGMGTIGATALLAGVMTVSAPLPFIFRRIGKRLRQKSRFAAH
ncbi:MFS general substrate transporter [Cylindrobasidium torrendii FP15055 ss-10]|uniref:MFS general substrate transporter n=1 Tax=Cylindrobasidium torrendii FP15055 ss-10 TaxID=1314674 RepID=A0A0D7BJB8_9AGAR|nr:MFS general substrate transporter [Cylindrobasidium torrendii FP15055 ss-10]